MLTPESSRPGTSPRETAAGTRGSRRCPRRAAAPGPPRPPWRLSPGRPDPLEDVLPERADRGQRNTEHVDGCSAMDPDTAGYGGRDLCRRLAADEVAVGEVEYGGGGDRVDPQARPPRGESAGADSALEGEPAEDGVEDVVGEAAQPVLLG